jgi:hypothetical protein
MMDMAWQNRRCELVWFLWAVAKGKRMMMLERRTDNPSLPARRWSTPRVGGGGDNTTCVYNNLDANRLYLQFTRAQAESVGRLELCRTLRRMSSTHRAEFRSVLLIE